MKPPTILAGGKIGSLYEGEFPQTLCFVPKDCVSWEGDRIHVLEGDYLRSGWDVRNMRFNDAGEGQHLFPNMDRPVVDLADAQVKNFLYRIGQIHAA